MSQIKRIAATGLLFATLACSASWAQTAKTDEAARKQAEALKIASEACDKGASAPLDFTAMAAPVQYSELFPYDFDMTKLRTLQGQCQTAWVGAPKETRFELQWLRVTMALGESNLKLLTPQVRKLAKEGSAEAQFLLYQLYRANAGAAESTMMDVSRDEASKSLLAAAEQGHMGAIGELMYRYRGSDDVKRDLKEVVRWARRLDSAPPQGIEITPFENDLRATVPMIIARTTLEEEGFSPTENRAAFKIAEKAMKAHGKDFTEASLVVARALRVGRGASKDAKRAREILEESAKTDRYAVPDLAEMLMLGEGGPEDGKRALALVRDKSQEYTTGARAVEGRILLDGKVVGYRPQEAIQALSRAYDPESFVLVAGLLIDYQPRLERPEGLIRGMENFAASGRDDVALALARLKLSDNSQFADEDGARALLKRLADADNRGALWLYASSQYRNLGSTSYQPTRREDGMSDAQLMALIDDGIRREEPEAFLLKAKFLRAGVLYPQDDRAASDMLRQAAKGDNIEALLRLGDAYDDGLGIEKNKKKRLEAWRRAAELGSVKAKSKISRAFTFDTFDRLMTLEEGVTWRIALYNNGYGRSFAGIGTADIGAQMDLDVFSGRAMEAGTDAVAEAIMNGFREAPAGLDDQNLVVMGKVFPQEIKVSIERQLARHGFYRGAPEGYWGPDARKALADWVEAKGYGTTTKTEVRAEEQPAEEPVVGELISKDTIGRTWDMIRADFKVAKTDKQKRAALAKVNILAQYGNIDARWALLPNYHQAATVRRVVSAAEITRYGLDLMVEKPPSAEKVEFEFIFNTTQIYQDGKSSEFGQAVLSAIRDDKRLQDPLVLGGILKQFIFAPGACDALLASGKRAGIDTMGNEGCDEESLSALVAHAKEKGPAGVDERNKKAAAQAIKDF